jgi:hypothetical protein
MILKVCAWTNNQGRTQINLKKKIQGMPLISDVPFASIKQLQK